jgi:hypothetical protein
MRWEPPAYRNSAKPVAHRFSRKELRERPELAEALGINDDPDAPETEEAVVQSNSEDAKAKTDSGNMRRTLCK